MLALSVPNLSQSPQTTTNFYLANIYQQLNGSQLSIPSNLSDPNQQFNTPGSAVWVNALWFSSLVTSLTCALLSTLLLRWARRYLRVAYPRFSPHKQARIRAFYKNGVDKLKLPWMIEFIPTLLHISLFLFFAGLAVFLFSVNLTVFKVVTAWIAVCVILYACLTFLPIFRKDSPYTAPLSTSVSLCLTGMRYLFYRLLQRFPQLDSSVCMPLISRESRAAHLGDFFSHSMAKTAEEFAFNKLKPDIDYDSLLWTFESLDEDTDVEKFFEGLPRLCDSETGQELILQQGFIIPHKKRLSGALIGLMNRTLSSNLVTEFVKQRRMIICTRAVDSPTSLLGPWWILCHVLHGDWYQFLRCIEFGLLVRNWKNASDRATAFSAQCVAALITSIVRHRDERWFQLASDILNAPKFLLQRYITSGDSILLANVIFIIRRTVQAYSGSAERHRTDILNASSRTLEALCKLNIQSTLPELQHEFCDLWNKLVIAAQSTQRLPHHVFISTMTLRNIRKLYIALHESPGGASLTPFYTAIDDPDVLHNPMSYPMCTVDEHRSSLPVQDLQFDEPAPDVGTPSIVPMPTPIINTMPAPSNTSIMAMPLPSNTSVMAMPTPTIAYPPTP